VIGRSGGHHPGVRPNGGLEPHETHLDLQDLGIDRAVWFPSATTSALAVGEPEFELALCRAYNRWVADFCAAYRTDGPDLPWKCTTTLHHLDEDLLRQMAAAGCVRVSVGLETLDPAGKEHLPRLKRIAQERFDAVASWCRTAGIELNCFVILGLPDTTLGSVRHTIAEVEAVGGRVRPTIYTDYGQMRCDMDVRTIASFNRQLFRPGQEPADAASFYRIMFNSTARRTDVAQRVPARAATCAAR
jgi:hypothetical protein